MSGSTIPAMSVNDICEIIYYDGMFGSAYYVQCVEKNSDVELLNERFSPAHKDYLFLGWSVEENSDDVKYHNRDTVFVGNDCPFKLYAVWKEKEGKKDEETEEICVVGYDPLPVLFHDMSKIRSLPTAKWGWDFGDSIVYCADTMYGITSEISGFILPGDGNMTQFVDQSASGALMYPETSGSYYNSSGNTVHFTGMTFGSSSVSANGEIVDGQTKYPAYPNSRQKRITKEVVGAKVKGIKIDPDQCGRVNCGEEAAFGNDIMHVYKGPGMYYATMWCESVSGLQSMNVDDSAFVSGDPAEKKQVYGCWINVLPACPCTKPSIIGVSGVVSSGFSADDDATSASGISEISGNEDGVYVGYAPFVYVRAGGAVVPRSLPVTGAWMDWHDWGVDFTSGNEFGGECKSDYARFGYPASGWPRWGNGTMTSAGEFEVSARDHAYTLPGVYSIGIYPVFADSLIRAYLPTVTDYEHCSEDSDELYALKNKIVVLEIPPEFQDTGIEASAQISTEYPSYVDNVKCRVKAGSYKIARVDWDFGDGTEIVSISIDGTSATDYNTDTTSAVWPQGGRVTTGYANGNSACGGAGEYERYDPRDWVLRHEYYPTTFAEIENGYTISCSAFAENTNTCVSTTLQVFVDPKAALPKFTDIEGSVELVDVRTDSSGKTNVVLQSEKADRLYVNRVE